MNKFENIQIGDSVFVRELICIGQVHGWGRYFFLKEFYVKLKVGKTTKTQFTAGGLRFKKDGRGIGDNHYHAYKPGERLYVNSNESVPTKCQRSEMQSYEKLIKPLRKYSTLIGKGEINPLRAKTVEDALEVHRLIKKAKWIIEGKNQENSNN